MADSETLKVLTDQTFDEEIRSASDPVLVDFWAPWCGPCKLLTPVLEEVAEAKKHALQFAQVNVDENQAVAQRFGIMSIPTVIVFRDGEAVKKLVGFQGKTHLLESLDEFLADEEATAEAESA